MKVSLSYELINLERICEGEASYASIDRSKQSVFKHACRVAKKLERRIKALEGHILQEEMRSDLNLDERQALDFNKRVLAYLQDTLADKD